MDGAATKDITDAMGECSWKSSKLAPCRQTGHMTGCFLSFAYVPIGAVEGSYVKQEKHRIGERCRLADFSEEREPEPHIPGSIAPRVSISVAPDIPAHATLRDDVLMLLYRGFASINVVLYKTDLNQRTYTAC